MIDDDEREAVSGIRIGRGKQKYLEKTCPSATMSTTYTTCPHLGYNPGRRDGKAATNRLSYGTALDFFEFNLLHLSERTLLVLAW
jgi:hypothetical protein